MIKKYYLIPLILLSAISILVAEDVCRVVDFGDDYVWTRGLPFYRGQSRKDEAVDLDLDGDGEKDDSVGYLSFSMTEPLNPNPYAYNYNGNNATFYGGMAAFFYNMDPVIQEGGINVNHENLDDFNWHAYATKRGAKLHNFATWIWKKEDFRNKGDKYPVSFNSDSRMAVRITRYFRDYDELRFIIKDSGQFYISEHSHAGRTYRVYETRPYYTRWAEYNPEAPYHIDYDPNVLDFKENKFTNVEAVGWIAAKLSDTQGSCWLKWVAFEAHAHVDKPEEPSTHLDMVKVPDRDFYVSKTEIDFSTWNMIYEWAARNQWATSPGYVFTENGDMGSMDLGTNIHTTKEPVTDITWYDALAWCNALSEYEGRTPVYYEDKWLSKPFRVTKERQEKDKMNSRPQYPVYVDWQADGYRLPTFDEYKAALNGESTLELGYSSWVDGLASGKTQPVGTSTASKLGVYDLIGNVWEYIWDIDSGKFNPASNAGRTVVGGDFTWPLNPAKESPQAHGEMPYFGSYRIGFRVIRYPKGGQKPVLKSMPSYSTYVKEPIPTWTFIWWDLVSPSPYAEDNFNAPVMKALPAGSFVRGDNAEVSVLPFEISTTEISYAQWNYVHQWAVVNGYEFNHDGDIGSMNEFYMDENYKANPKEPVTHINFSDALIWCNAYSEMQGKTPIYYADEDKRLILKSAQQFRNNMLVPDNYDRLVSYGAGRGYEYYAKWEEDGYRLPTEAEWEYAAKAGRDEVEIPEEESSSAWVYFNSDLRTHPIGTKEPNPFGLHDTMGNVFEMTWSDSHMDYYDTVNPRGPGDPAFKGGSYKVRGSYYEPMLTPGDRFAHTIGGKLPAYAYAEIGFRIARSEKGVQPAKRSKPPEKIIFDIDLENIDTQQGKTYRANIYRNGVFVDKGPAAPSKAVWEYDTGAPVYGSPVAVDGLVYIIAENGMLFALNEDSGEVAWQYEGSDSHASVSVANGKVFVQMERNISALDAKTGSIIWQNEHNYGGARANSASPLVLNDYVYMKYRFKFVGMDTKSGNMQWKFREGGAPSYIGSAAYIDGKIAFFKGSPSIHFADAKTERRRPDHDCMIDSGFYTVVTEPKEVNGIEDRVYAISAQGLFAMKNPGTEEDERLWTYSLSHWKNDRPEFSSPAVDDKKLYIGNADGHLYAIDKTTGMLKWKFNAKSVIYSSPAVSGNIVYFGAYDGNLYAVDKNSGELLSKTVLGGKLFSSPWIEEGRVYIASLNGKLYAVE